MTSCSFILNFTLGGRTLMIDSVSIDEAFLSRVKEAIEKNYSDSSYGVDELSRDVGISRAQLYRRLQNLTGIPANQMIKEFRLKRAFEMLQMKIGTISEIAYQVGFSSPSYFNTCFSEYFGYSPGKVKPASSATNSKRFSLSRKSVFIIGATGIVAVLVLLVLILSPWKDRVTGNPRDKQTSIAVLPFISLSADAGDQYLADAMMDEIILHLSSNQELRVMPRISVEKYRSKDKNLKQIARELNVEYILDGSFQKQGDKVNIIVSLVHASTSRIEWKYKYPGSWKDILTIQSQIAQRIARELDIEFTPEVIQIMGKTPTTSPEAADFYWRGNNEYIKNTINPQDSIALKSAERLFHKAIRMDSTYARAYVGLAEIYWRKHYWDTFLSEDFDDSALILADKALSFDRQLAEAYVIRGFYYGKINNKEQAFIEYDRAISLNPSSAKAYIGKAVLYLNIDLVNRIENFQKAALLERGENLPPILRRLAVNYAYVGFKEIACSYIKNALELDDDSAAYYEYLSEIEHVFGDFKRAIELGKKSYAIDSTEWSVSYLIGVNYSLLDNSEESFEWLKRYEAIQFKSGYNISSGTFWGTFRLAHAYCANGFMEKANYYLTEGLALYDKMLELNRHYDADILTFYYLAALYAFQGNKEKAYEYLIQLNNWRGKPLWIIPCLNYDPMFDSLREESQFQQIVSDVEAKYQAEHERVRQWLEENDML